MTHLFKIYQNDILALFKAHYLKLLAQNIELPFESILQKTIEELGVSYPNKEDVAFLRDWYDNIQNLEFLNFFLQGTFNEMILHSHEDLQIISPQGKESIILQNLNALDFQVALEVLALKNKVSWNFQVPFASFNTQLFGISVRATLIHATTSSQSKSKLFLRKVYDQRPSLAMYPLKTDTMDFLKEIILDKKNILISGGTGSGKTTFLRSLVAEIPQSEHLIILEDTYEIMNTHPHQTSLLAGGENEEKKSLKDFCAYALRMSPDRLIVGEMRSSEVVPFVLAMNTGHKGLMSTVHANSAVDAISRVALLFSLYQANNDISFSLVTQLVCKNVDYVIHIENKKIKEVIKVLGADQEIPFYEKVFECTTN